MVLLLMIFMHIVDDYYLQGILASMKQSKWWQKQESYNSKYKYDYIVALIMHAFSWTFMIMSPLAIIHRSVNIVFFVGFGVNLIIHAIADDLKANKGVTNLVIDQSIHILQIIITFIVLR